jgi:hypothetical protein
VLEGLVEAVVKILLAYNPRRGEAIVVDWIWATFALLAVTFAAAFTQAFSRRIRGLAVARQKIRTREATYAEFSTVFSLLDADAAILEVLEKAPLEPRYKET